MPNLKDTITLNPQTKMVYQFLWMLVVGKQNTLAENVKCAYGDKYPKRGILEIHRKFVC